MRSRWLGFVVFAATVIFSIWAYPRLPSSVATHFGFDGEANGYSSRWTAAFLLPVIILVARLFRDVLPKIDPRKRNYEKFIDTYWLLSNWILVFLGAVHVVILGRALGWPISTEVILPAGIGFLFVLIGNYLGRVEPNWFLGVRTPWTLSSDSVWRKTNRTAGWLFMAAGAAIMIASPLHGRPVRWVLGGILASVVLVPVVQSYVLWRREQGTSH